MNSKLWDPDPNLICRVGRCVENQKSEPSDKDLIHGTPPLIFGLTARYLFQLVECNPKSSQRYLKFF